MRCEACQCEAAIQSLFRPGPAWPHRGAFTTVMVPRLAQLPLTCVPLRSDPLYTCLGIYRQQPVTINYPIRAR
jgi:hypothetical protein